MKSIATLFLSLALLLSSAARAETILWEDENGQVLQDDDGAVHFVAPDGAQTLLFSASPAPGPQSSEETPVPAAQARYRRNLAYGSSGEPVRALQERLAQLGYYQARVSGGYYDVTRKAVRAFQAQNGLSVDGVAGKKTQEALYAQGAVPAGATPLPTATPEPPRYRLLVDVTNQITRAYTHDASGQYTVLVREMICSTGTRSNPTPLGTSVMPKKRARWGYFPTWDSHAQYLTRIDAANAFHSVLYEQPVEEALVVSSYEGLGERKSHGCVRLLVSDAKWIYDNCSAGTEIVIYESGHYDPEYTMTLLPPLNPETLRERARPAPTPTPEYRPENWPKRYRTLSRGRRGEDVFMLQMRLTELGYYAGSVTGGYYGGTIEAVRAFQEASGLQVDGVAGTKTQQALYAQGAAHAGTTPAPTASPVPTPSPTPAPTPVPDPARPRRDALG